MIKVIIRGFFDFIFSAQGGDPPAPPANTIGSGVFSKVSSEGTGLFSFIVPTEGLLSAIVPDSDVFSRIDPSGDVIESEIR